MTTGPSLSVHKLLLAIGNTSLSLSAVVVLETWSSPWALSWEPAKDRSNRGSSAQLQKTWEGDSPFQPRTINLAGLSDAHGEIEMKPIYILFFSPPKIEFFNDEYFSVETETVLPKAPKSNFHLMEKEDLALLGGVQMQSQKRDI